MGPGAAIKAAQNARTAYQRAGDEHTKAKQAVDQTAKELSELSKDLAELSDDAKQLSELEWRLKIQKARLQQLGGGQAPLKTYAVAVQAAADLHEKALDEAVNEALGITLEVGERATVTGVPELAALDALELVEPQPRDVEVGLPQVAHLDVCLAKLRRQASRLTSAHAKRHLPPAVTPASRAAARRVDGEACRWSVRFCRLRDAKVEPPSYGVG